MRDDHQRAGFDAVRKVVRQCYPPTPAVFDAVADEVTQKMFDALLAVPVEQRMEAMGMVPIDTADGVLYGCQEDWT